MLFRIATFLLYLCILPPLCTFKCFKYFYEWHMISGNSSLQALSAAGLSLVSTETNLVDQVWEDHGRPDPPNEGLIVMDMSYTGQ